MKAKRILASVVVCLMLVMSMAVVASAEGTATVLPEAVNGVITLTENVTLTEKVVIDKDITIDLNGKTLTLPAFDNYAITVKDTLTIKDSAEGGSVVSMGVYGIGTSTNCKGGLNIEGGNFSNPYWDDTYGGGYIIGVFGGDVKITGGTFSTLGTVVNNFEGYTGSVEIEGGSFASTGSNYWSDPFLGVNISVKGGTFSEAIPADYLADGKLTSKNAEGVYEIITAEAKATAIYDETSPVYEFASFEEAVEAAKEWDTITLLDNAALTEKVVVDKWLAVDGNGYKITTSAQKLFEVYADFYVSDLKMESTNSSGRCVDTRVDGIEVIIDNCELKTVTGNGWAQAVTIGGSETEGLTMTITDSVIESKYVGIIMWVPAELTVENTSITAWGAIYAKGDSGAETSGSVITVVNSDLKTVNDKTSTSEDFAAIVIEDDDVTVTVDEASTIELDSTGTCLQSAVVFNEKAADVTINGEVKLKGDLTVVVLDMNDGATLTVTNPDVIEAVKAEGYIVADNGSVTVPDARWMTDLEAGFYMEEETKFGLLRFLFAAETDEEVIASGIKYIKVSDIADKETAAGIEVDANGEKAFYGDINGIPEEAEGMSLIAVAYIRTATNTYWSNAVVGTVDMTSKQFTDYVAGGAQ